MHALETPQEVQVWYVIPALRRQMAREMLRAGLKQKEIALKLNITEAAVSQYLRSKRASSVKFTDAGKNAIRETVSSLIAEKAEFNAEIQRLLHFMLENKTMCHICQTHTGMPKSCRACFD